MASNWPYAVSGVPSAVAAIVAAYFSRSNSRQLKTGNDKTVGEMVTDVHGEASHQATGYDTHRESK